MPTKPAWLLTMSNKAKAQLLAKAHAIILENIGSQQFANANIYNCASMVWAIKSEYENKVKREGEL